MIKLKIPNINNNTFSSIFSKLYVATSIKPFPTYIYCPKELKDFVLLVYNVFSRKPIIKETKFFFKKNIQKQNNKVLCAFSGGKDCVANVINLQKQGYETILCYIKGINKSYPNEEIQVKKLAKKLHSNLIIFPISISGKCDYVENPIKNIFILSLMVDYGIDKDINKYSFGNMLDDNIDELPAEVELSDAIELFKEAEKFYKNFISDFQIITTLKNENHSYKIIYEYDLSLLQDTISCISPYRYQKQLRDKNEKKFNMKFKNNSCGCSCYKCCQELMILNKLVKDFNLKDDVLKKCEDVTQKFDEKNNTKTDWIDEEILNS